jgi:hypothetical protein
VEAEIVMVQKYYFVTIFLCGIWYVFTWNDVTQQYGMVQYYRYTRTYHSSEKPAPVSVPNQGYLIPAPGQK